MATVVAGIDLTPLGRRVAERARLVAERCGSRVEILHVAESAPDAFIDEHVQRLIRSHREKATREVAEWVAERASVEIDWRVVKGSPAWEMVRAGKSALLTVMGSSSVDASRCGPVSRRVAEAGWGDVLVVRRQPRAPYRRAVAAVDLSPASERAIDLAQTLVGEGEVTLVFALPTRFDALMAEAGMFTEEIDLHRSGRLERARRAIEELAASRGPQIRTIVSDGPAVEVVGEAVRRRSADVTVVASRGAGATRMVMLGTVASRLLEAVPSDVAVARVPADFRRP